VKISTGKSQTGTTRVTAVERAPKMKVHSSLRELELSLNTYLASPDKFPFDRCHHKKIKI
jgi:hypothetical protein